MVLHTWFTTKQKKHTRFPSAPFKSWNKVYGKGLFALCSLCLLVVMGRQEAAAQLVPDPIQKSFNANFAGATNIHWLKWDNKSFEANFKLRQDVYMATFDAAGKILEKGIDVDSADIPSLASNELLTMIEDGDLLRNIFKVTRGPNDTVYYVDRWVEKAGEHQNSVRYVFDRTGKMKDEKIPMPDEADDDLNEQETQQPQDKHEEEAKDHDDRVEHHTQEAETHLQTVGDDDDKPEDNKEDEPDAEELDANVSLDDDAPTTTSANPSKPNK